MFLKCVEEERKEERKQREELEITLRLLEKTFRRRKSVSLR